MKKTSRYSELSRFAVIVFFVLIYCLIIFPARATLDFFEPFNYTYTNEVKQSITNFPAYNGTNYWIPSGTPTNIVLTNFTLLVPGLSNGTGNAVAAGPPAGASGLRRLLIDPVTGQSNSYSSSVNAGIVYFSTALQITDRGSRAGSDDWHTTNTYSILGALGNAANANGFLCIMGQQQVTDTNTYRLGVAKASSSTVFTSDPTLHSNDVVFVVGRYTFNPGVNDDECALWINPDPTTFGAASAPAGALISFTATDIAAPMDRFNFRCTTSGAHVGSPNQIVWDELRVGSTWADVTPSAPVLPLLSVSQSGSNVVISWPASATDFVLQSTPTFSPTSWINDTNQVVVSNGTNTVTETMLATTFFRLKK